MVTTRPCSLAKLSIACTAFGSDTVFVSELFTGDVFFYGRQLAVEGGVFGV